MAEISTDDIERWLASIPDEDHDIAARQYMLARGSHREGDLPTWMRVQWSQLPAAYRAFLVSMVQAGRDNPRCER